MQNWPSVSNISSVIRHIILSHCKQTSLVWNGFSKVLIKVIIKYYSLNWYNLSCLMIFQLIVFTLNKHVEFHGLQFDWFMINSDDHRDQILGSKNIRRMCPLTSTSQVLLQSTNSHVDENYNCNSLNCWYLPKYFDIQSA